METRNRIRVIALSCILLSATALGITAPRLIAVGRDARWSPDEKYISYLRNDTLYASPLDETQKSTAVMAGPIIKHEWLSERELAVQTRQYYPHSTVDIRVERIFRCSLDGQPELIASDSVGGDSQIATNRLRLTRFADGKVGYFTNASGAEKIETLSEKSANVPTAPSPNLYVRCDPQPRGPVWLHYGDTSNRRVVLTESGQYILPQLAPTSDKFFCKNNNGELVVFDTNGVSLGNLGRASMPRWDNTGHWIVYCEATWGHFDLIASDLVIARFDGQERTRLTQSPEIEEEPAFSPSGAYLMYRDGKSGQIFVVGIN